MTSCDHAWARNDDGTGHVYVCRLCGALGYARRFGLFGGLERGAKIVAYRCCVQGCQRDATRAGWQGMARARWCAEHGDGR